MFGDLGKMLKAASEMKARLPEIQAKIEAAEFTGHGGGDTVAAVVNGKGMIRDIRIKPGVLQGDDDREMFQDLILAAVSSAQKQATEAAEAMMQELVEELGLPEGYKDMLG